MRFAMKVTIHISHCEADDLAAVEAQATRLGLAVVARGDFMGRRHTEFAGDMSAAALANLLDNGPEPSAVAA
jgi:hypothetical protein